jgi:hypothetical protein
VAGGPAPQANLLKRRAVKWRKINFPLYNRLLNQRNFIPRWCHTFEIRRGEHKQKKITSASANDTLREATSEEIEKVMNFILN